MRAKMGHLAYYRLNCVTGPVFRGIVPPTEPVTLPFLWATAPVRSVYGAVDLRAGSLWLRLVAGQHLAQWSRRRIIEIDASHGSQPFFEPVIERLLGVRELPQRLRKVGALL